MGPGSSTTWLSSCNGSTPTRTQVVGSREPPPSEPQYLLTLCRCKWPGSSDSELAALMRPPAAGCGESMYFRQLRQRLCSCCGWPRRPSSLQRLLAACCSDDLVSREPVASSFSACVHLLRFTVITHQLPGLPCPRLRRRQAAMLRSQARLDFVSRQRKLLCRALAIIRCAPQIHF